MKFDPVKLEVLAEEVNENIVEIQQKLWNTARKKCYMGEHLQKSHCC